MLGMMMNEPLLISSILRYGENYYSDTEIVSQTVEGSTHRYTYRDLAKRSRQLAKALEKIGLSHGERVGTLAWNGYRHLELYYGVSGAGFVCHTINPRLFPTQIAYIIAHANDSVLFCDLTFFPLLEALASQLAHLKAIVVMTDAAHMPNSKTLPNLLCYETLLEVESDDYEWPIFDENTASGLCYTSGTTGKPKGVLYSHRSSVLHAMGINIHDALALSATDVIVPIVPMFHVNAWGLPYSSIMVGAKIVMAGPHHDGASLYTLFENEGVTAAAGVPTIWLGLLDWMRENNKQFSSLNRIIIGGSAVPPIMIEQFFKLGVDVKQAWGMTETSPAGLATNFLPVHQKLMPKERLSLIAKQGRPLFGIEFRILDTHNNPVARDGKSFGSMWVRGAWVASGYYNDEPHSAFKDDGWFNTGDVVTMDENGFVQIVDRDKDIVKSGGEWISSIELENIAQSHPAIKEAAVVAKPDKRWGERPILVVQLHAESQFSHEDMIALYQDKIPKWSLPDKVITVDALPHTATGKLLKTAIREIVLKE